MERIFRHSSPGYTLPLWLDGKPIKTKNGKSNAIFRDTGKSIDRCGIFRTNEDEVTIAVEQSKGFKRGAILRLKSDDELRLETLKKEREKFQEEMISLSEQGLFNIEALKKKKQKELHEFATKLGLETADGKGNKTNASILGEIKEILFPNMEEEEE